MLLLIHMHAVLSPEYSLSDLILELGNGPRGKTMVGSITALSIAGMVVALIIRVTTAFTIPEMEQVPDAPVDEMYSPAAVEQAGDLIANRYTSILDEIISLQMNPDYERAEATSQHLMSKTVAIAGMIDGFSQRMQGEFDNAIAEAEAQQTATP